MPSVSEDEQGPPLWQYVSLADYEPPAAPLKQAAREGLTFLRELFRRQEPEPGPLLMPDEDLETLPRWQLDRLAPPPDWHGAAQVLSVEIKDWLQEKSPAVPVIVLVGPPYSGHGDVLAAWAEQEGWPTLDAPAPERLLAGEASFLDSEEVADAWVFPGLEKAYLRHASGLGLVRRFLDRAYSGALGRGIIGCDSWAWAFLRHVWHGRRPITLTLQAFPQARLAEMFRNMAESASSGPIAFCQADNGQYVLAPPDTEDEPAESSDFLHLLAAHSRGILEVARAVWRDSLRAEPEDLAEEGIQDQERKLLQQTIWVTPWEKLSQPSLPPNAGRDEAIVLHTLLLHNGLPFELLPHLLPLSSSQAMETLFRLEECGLVAQQNAEWRVSTLGYPPVRRFLQTSGYLADQF